MTSNLYMPVLRAKEGEIQALGYLSHHARSRIKPLIDIPTPNLNDSQSLSGYLGEKVNSLADSWGVDQALLIDLPRFDPNSRVEGNIHPVEYVFEIASQRRMRAIPVTGTRLSRGPEPDYLNAVSKIVKKCGRGIALRFYTNEFCKQSKFATLVEETRLLVDVDPEDCDIILDFEALDRLSGFDDINDIEKNLKSAISSIDYENFRNVIVCGSSVPEFVGPKFNGSSCKVARVEFDIWKKLVVNEQFDRIGFGDYGIIYPLTSDNPKSGLPPARIRLSTENEHILYRSPRNSYRQLCAMVAKESLFRLQTNCWGKKCIAGYGSGYSSVGNPANWVARDTNAHIENTVHHLSSNLTESMEGTQNIPSVLGVSYVQQNELEFIDE
jgi:hypothetical protein